MTQEEDFAQFLPDGNTQHGKINSFNHDQIMELQANDKADLEENTNAAQTAKSRFIRNKLRTVVAIMGKCVSEGH